MLENREYYKTVWATVIENCQAAVAKGEILYPQIKTNLTHIETSRTEVALGSQYLPRGFYCPSPDIECIITNMHRGRIAKRTSKISKPTNFYRYDKSGRLYLAETVHPSGSTETEYIVSAQNVVYGFTYSQTGRVTSISVEEYANDRLCSYLWASCSYNERSGYKLNWILNENLHYPDCRHLETDFYILQKPTERVYIARWKTVYDIAEDGKIALNSNTSLLCEEENFAEVP